MLNNLPVTIPDIEAYKGHALVFHLDFEVGFSIPSPVAVVLRDGPKVLPIVPDIATNGQRRTVTFTATQVKQMKGVTEWALFLGDMTQVSGRGVVGGKIKPKYGSSESSDELGFLLKFENGIVIEVQVTSAALLSAMLTQAAGYRDEAKQYHDEFFDALPVRVATFASMLNMLEEEKPRQVVVINDEYQNDTSVPYLWDGVQLFEYNISLCDVQPTF